MKKQRMTMFALIAAILLMVTLIVVIINANHPETPVVTEVTTQVTTSAATTIVTEPVTGTPTPTVAVTVTASPTPAITASPTPTPTPTAAVDDGTYEAYVWAVSTSDPDTSSQGTITVQLAPIFTGADAIAQAKEEGHADIIEIDEDGNEYIPNDYYISSAQLEKYVLWVSNTCSIRVFPEGGLNDDAEDFCVDGTLPDLQNNVSKKIRYATIEVSGGRVVFIGEFYIP